MEDKKPCARCNRAIDPYAKICPYCNWDQTAAAPAPGTGTPAVQANAYVPPNERNWKRHLLMAGAVVLLLIGSFAIGAIINRDDAAPEDAPTPVLEQAETGIARTRRADVTLVPVTEGTGLEQPITSAPLPNLAEGVPTEYQRHDATAVSSVEYAALAQRAEAERKAQQQKQMVDPRSLTGPAYAQAPRRPAPQPAAVPPPMTSASADSRREEAAVPDREPARVVERTRPIPQHQPLPSISVSKPVTARLELTVGADGRVKQVRIKNSVPGHTPELIAAVQSWRFKPATENGQPVSAPFTVDISFNP